MRATQPPERFAVEYYGRTLATFQLREDGKGGTDLLLTDEGVASEGHAEVHAGWTSVLLGLKAAADFGVDVGSDDPPPMWAQGYVDS